MYKRQSHGGALDNPGLVTLAVGNVLDKWDQVWEEKEADLGARNRMEGTDGAAIGDILPCSRMKRLPAKEGAEEGENGTFDAQVRGSGTRCFILPNFTLSL